MNGVEPDTQTELVKGILALPAEWVAWIILIGLAVYMGPHYIKAVGEIVSRWRLDSTRVRSSQIRLMHKLEEKHKAKLAAPNQAGTQTPALGRDVRDVAPKKKKSRRRAKPGVDQ
jgi:hypothetical protein